MKTLKQQLKEKANGNPKLLNLFGEDLETVIETVMEWLEQKSKELDNNNAADLVLGATWILDELLGELGE